MPAFRLKNPYKIIPHKTKRYALHYGIPSELCVIIPVRLLGDEVSCDVRWQDGNGELQLKEQLIFRIDNLEPVDAMRNYELFELWNHYYGEKTGVENTAIANPGD